MKKHLQILIILAAFLMPWVGQAQTTLTVADGTSTNEYVPIYGYYADAYLRCQILYPESMVGDMAGSTISAMKFHSSNSSVSWGSANFQVKIGTTSATTLSSSWESTTSMETVYTGSLSINGSGEMTVTFSTPFVYSGGNLLVEVNNLTEGNYVSCSWLGVSASGASIQGYDYDSWSGCSPSAQGFIPKTTFSYLPGEISCRFPVSIAASEVTSTSATISWVDTSSNSSWRLYYYPTDSVAVMDSMDVYDTSYVFTDLYANTDYTVKVAAICSDGLSFSRSTTFRTLCGDQEIPFTADFNSDESDAAPLCWTLLNGSTSYDVHVDPWDYSVSGNSLVFGMDCNGGCIASPRVPMPINEAMVRFYYLCENTSYSGTLSVGYTTDLSEPDSIHFVETIIPQTDANSTSTFTECEVMFSNVPTTDTGWVVFRQNAGGNCYYYWIDNVTFMPIPSCPHVSNFAATYLTVDSAIVSWHENGEASAWIIEYDTVNFVPGTGAAAYNITAYDTTYVLDGLDTATTYYAYIHADCGGDTSENTFISFTTLSALPAAVPYACDFEGEGSNGWELYNGTQTNKWYVGSAVNHGGSKSLYISNTNGSSNNYSTGDISYTYAKRTFALSENGEYAYSFDWRCQGESSYYDFLRVFLIPAGEDNLNAGSCPGGSTYDFCQWTPSSTWYDLSGKTSYPYTLNQASTWQTRTGTLQLTAGTYNLVFAWANDGSGGSNPAAAVDNVSFIRNSCPQVRNLHVEYAGEDTIIVAWQPGGDETEWMVSSGSEEYNTVDTFYVFDNLQSASAYTFGIRAICGGDDTSLASTITARTQCGNFGPLPLNEDFTGMSSSSYPDCWYRVTNTYSYPYVTTSYGNALQSGGDAYIVSPRIPAPVNSLVVSFDLQKEGSSSGTMEFGYTTSATAIADSTVILYSVAPSATYSYNRYEFDLSIDTSLTDNFDSVYLVWHQVGSTNYYYWLDNILVEPANPCTKPTNLVCTANGNPDSVAIQWTEAGSATSWQVFYGATGVTPNEDDATDVYDNHHVISGLTMGNSYDVYVRSDCGDGYSNWRGPLTIIPGSINLPTAGTRTITGCGITIYDDGGAEGNYSASVDGAVIVYPSTDSIVGIYGTFSGESCCDYLYIYDGAGMGGTQLHYGLGYGATGTIDTLYSTTGPLTVRLTSDGSGQYAGLELHTFCIPAPECGHVEDLSVTPGITTAMVSWTPSILGTYAGAEVDYREAGDTTASWITVTTTDTYAPLTGLTANTLYDVRVAAECGGVLAEWMDAQFLTRDFECLVIDSAMMHNDTITGSTTTSYNIPVNNYYCNTFSEQLYTAAELDSAGTITGFSLNLAYAGTMTSKTNCTVYLANTSRTYVSSSDYIDPADMTKVYTGSLNCSNGWNHFDFNETTFPYSGGNLMVAVIDNSGTYNSSSYVWSCHSASGRAMSWYSDSYTYPNSSMSKVEHGFVPDIVFNFAECTQQRSCAVPVASVANVTSNSADLVWAPGNVETSWSIYARPAGAVNYTYYGTVTNTSYSFTGLMPGTNYEFMVTALCGDDSNSAVLTAATQCAKIATLPYTENFNSWGTGSIPNCWYKTGSYSTYGNISSSYNHSGATGGSIYTYASSGTTYTTYTIMPEIDTALFQANQLQFVFDAYNPSTSYTVDYAIGVMTDANDVSSFVPVDTIHVSTVGQWEEFEVPLNNYTGDGGFVAVKSAYITAYGYGYIDDFTLEMIPTCPRPDSLHAANATTSTVDLSWHERGGATDWIIEYGPVGFTLGTGTIVNATSNPFTLTGLSSSYDGEFYVRSVCSNTDTGLYSRIPCRFSTAQMAATLPYTCDFEDVEANAWQTSSNSTINWFVGTADAASPTHGMYISADNGLTVGNQNYSSVVNASAFRDVDFGTVDSSFTFTFKAKAGGSTDAAYDALMVFLVDPSVPVVSSDANITCPWGNVNDLYRIATVRLDTTWREYSASFDTIHGIQRVAFFWFNQNTASSHPYMAYPAAFDDITIDYSPCPRPVNMDVDTALITSTSATLTWDGPASAQYRVAYRVGGAPASTNRYVNTSTNSITLTGLDPITTYYAWVQKLCGSDSSLFSDGIEFTTDMCDNMIMITNDTVCTQSTSYFPGYSFYNYSYSEVIIDSADLAGIGDITAFSFKPQTANAGSYYTNCYIYMANTSQSDLSSGFIQDPSTFQLVYTGDMTYTDNSWQIVGLDTTFTWDGHSNVVVAINRQHGSYSSSYDYFDAFTATSSKARYIYNDGSAYSVGSISGGTSTTQVPIYRLISCGAATNCATPTITGTSHTYESVTVNWTGTGANYEVAIKESAATDWGVEIPVTGNSYTFYGLTPTTNYDVRVRQDCTADSLDYSNWAQTTVLTDSLPCMAPQNLTVSDITNATANFSWTVLGYETAWNIHVWYGTFDSTYYVTTNPATLSGFTAGVTYNAAIRPLCGSAHNLVGEYGDTVTFTTQVCPNVTGLGSRDVTASSVTLFWNADPMAESWTIEYGRQGFSQGSGTTATSATTTYVVNGLSDDTPYDFYVKAVCGTDWTSENWASVSATTAEGAVTCDAPTNVTAVVAGNGATINWAAGAGNISFELEYGTHGFSHGAGTTMTATTAPATISNLLYDTQYDVYVRAICAQNTYSAWSTMATFTTEPEASTDCDPVTNLATTSVTDNSVAVSWTPGENGDTWEVVLTDAAGETLQQDVTSETTHQFTNLTQATNYIIKVRTKCGDDQYSNYATVSFRTTGETEGIDDVTNASCTIYPNPTSSATTISVSGVNGQVRIAVVDMNGRVVTSETMECSTDCTKTLDVENLAQGAYFVRITGENINMVKKLVVK